MRNTRVLLIGLKGLISEVCKNLVLAGVHSVTILEHEKTSATDLSSHLFLSEEDIGKNVKNCDPFIIMCRGEKLLSKKFAI